MTPLKDKLLIKRNESHWNIVHSKACLDRKAGDIHEIVKFFISVVTPFLSNSVDHIKDLEIRYLYNYIRNKAFSHIKLST